MTHRAPFYLELVKCSHYDDDGYVLQWWRSFIPSNSLASVNGLACEVAERRVLGDDVDIVVNAYDETNITIPIKGIAKRITSNAGRGVVCLVGVQTNQYPRALDIARQFRALGVQVAIGGFHVSGCISMLKDMPADLQEALDMGCSLYAGEADGRLEEFLVDVHKGEMKPVYNYLKDLPDMQEHATPFLPQALIDRYAGSMGSFDAGRGCPFACSFCTIINVQGRKSRFRDADDIEQIVRSHRAQGIHRFFVSDDNFARNKNWESVFDRLIELREEGLGINFLIQCDTLVHKIPNFIEKAAKAGCKQVFLGLENINPENLKEANKAQNKITEYRSMLQEWRNHGVVTYGGYILGFPADTPETIKRDIAIIQRELPIDILEFNILTPLPGSVDHKVMYETGVWMDPDMNKYDLEHITTKHATMTTEQWEKAYQDAWTQYYTPEHMTTLLRRGVASGIKGVRLVGMIWQFCGSVRYENAHPLQAGVFRRRQRTQRRPGMALENPLVFYPRYWWQLLWNNVRSAAFYVRLRREQRRIQSGPQAKQYTDLALTPVEESANEHLQLFEATDAAKHAVAKAKKTKLIIKNARDKSKSKAEDPVEAEPKIGVA